MLSIFEKKFCQENFEKKVFFVFEFYGGGECWLIGSLLLM